MAKIIPTPVKNKTKRVRGVVNGKYTKATEVRLNVGVSATDLNNLLGKPVAGKARRRCTLVAKVEAAAKTAGVLKALRAAIKAQAQA